MNESTVRRCTACGTLFEPGVADPAADGEARCPQCFLSESVPVTPDDDQFVVRASTSFR